MNVLDRPLTELELQSLLTHLSSATEPETAEAPTASSWHVPEPPRECIPFPETWHFVVAGASPDGEYAQPESDAEGNCYVDMLFPDEYHKLILDGPPGDGCARLRVYTSSSSKKAVVERDTDLLTPDEFRIHAKEVAAATHEELKIWIDHGCFTRRSRQGARNILDVRWVGK